MKNVIICEGNTDLTLIQYFLEKVYEWEYIERNSYKNFEEGVISQIQSKNSNNIKWLRHNNGNILCILSCGG